MSRWADRIEAWRTMARKPGLANAAPFRAASAKSAAFMSRTTLWVDGQHAHALKPARDADAPLPLSTPGDVAAALAAIETLAPKPASPGLHALRVVVGAPFACYYALPWQALAKPQDWVPAARALALRSGAGGEAWRYAVSDGAWGQGRLAAAIPEALCAGIERLCKKRRLQLLGIEPGYTFALQKHAPRIHDGAIAIVELEQAQGDAAIAHIGVRRGGGWTAFIGLPVFRATGGGLDDVLRDAFALCVDAPPERRYVIGPRDARHWAADASLIEWLPSPWDGAA